jgi:hypothetical protein
MKKFYLIAAMAACTLVANAQERLILSTYNGTNIEKYDGKTCHVTVNRMIFKGWNTIALPFAMNESELNEAFGSDCRLERLTGAEDNGSGITLCFLDCKATGLEANTPYILYYTGETGNKKIVKEAIVSDRQAALTISIDGSAETVTMAGVGTKTDGAGLYGILAVDNGEAKFVKVDETTSGFLATRCYVQLSSGNHKMLSTRHLAAGETTSIDAVAAKGELVDVYNNRGVRVASQVRATEVGKLQPGIYVVKGQKILVK